MKHLMGLKDNSSFPDVYTLVILTQANHDGAFRALLTCPNKAIVQN